MLLAKFIHINMDKIKRPKLYTLPDTLSRQSSPRRRPDLSGMVCLASGTAYPATCRVPSFRVRWMGQGCTGGVYRERRGWGR